MCDTHIDPSGINADHVDSTLDIILPRRTRHHVQRRGTSLPPPSPAICHGHCEMGITTRGSFEPPSGSSETNVEEATPSQLQAQAEKQLPIQVEEQTAVPVQDAQPQSNF